jgi:hypothetical protein
MEGAISALPWNPQQPCAARCTAGPQRAATTRHPRQAAAHVEA